MKHRTSQILFAYWNEVRRGRLAPRRFDIEPARIATILAETLILERIEPQAYRFRLAGTRVGENFATELRGHDFLSMWRKSDREEITGRLQHIAKHGGAAVLDFELTGSWGRSATFEAILLPLTHSRDVVDRFLGAISPLRQESWLGTERPTTTELTRSTIVPLDDWHPPDDLATVEPPPFHPHLAQGRIVRHDRRQFRVLDGGLAERQPAKS